MLVKYTIRLSDEERASLIARYDASKVKVFTIRKTFGFIASRKAVVGTRSALLVDTKLLNTFIIIIL